MKLFLYDFLISYRLGKINSIDTFLKRLNYKGENELINRLLFTLQQKLIKVKSLLNFILAIIKIAYKDSVDYIYRKYNLNSKYLVVLNSLSINKSSLDTSSRKEVSIKKIIFKNLIIIVV